MPDTQTRASGQAAEPDPAAERFLLCWFRSVPLTGFLMLQTQSLETRRPQATAQGWAQRQAPQGGVQDGTRPAREAARRIPGEPISSSRTGGRKLGPGFSLPSI